MGCAGSKSVAVRLPSRGSSVSREHSVAKIGEDEINIFGDTSNNENELGGSCYNAKPRLRSAIRRGTDIKPVVSEVNATSNIEESDSQIKLPPLDITEEEFIFEPPSNRDSGFDSHRIQPEDSARTKTDLRDETSSVTTTSTTMRPDSVLTGSVLTARDLNASFMTMSEDYTTQTNGDVSLDLDTPFEDLSEFENSHYRTLSNTPSHTYSNTPSRTLSNTPSARPLSSTPSRLVFSTEPINVPLYPKSIDVIKEESEGGFTPRSLLDDVVTPRIKLETPREGLPKYYSEEVVSHNQNVAWSEWGIHKGTIYNASKVINAFSEIYTAYNRKKNDTRSSDDDSDDGGDGSIEELPPYDSVYPKKVLNPRTSMRIAIDILLKAGIPIKEIYQNLPLCEIGKLKTEPSPQSWHCFRNDVNTVLDDLIRDDLKDGLSEYTKEIYEQLQRWILKYRNQNPQPEQKRSGDPNAAEFNLPDGIRENSDCLRRWLQSWKRFDLELSESDAWYRYEVEAIDLGDPQEIFEASLRDGVDLCNPFDTSVDGEAAWEVLLVGVVADDIMTNEQRVIEERRRFRTDLHDTKRMERRRAKLLNYFAVKYEMDKNKVDRFLQWSQAIEEGEARFQLLCENS